MKNQKKYMKKFFLAVIIMAAAFGFAQTGQTQILQVGYAWSKSGDAGRISQAIWERNLPSGHYRINGRYVTVVRGNFPTQVQIKFRRGYSAYRNYNWTDLPARYAVWCYGEPEWSSSVDGFVYWTNAVAVDACGNLLDGVRRPASIVVQSTTTTNKEPYYYPAPTRGGYIPPLVTNPVQNPVQGFVKQTSFYNEVCFVRVLEKYPQIAPMADDYYRRGLSRDRAWKRAIRRSLRGEERRKALSCYNGTTWWGRNWPWATVVATISMGIIKSLLKKGGSIEEPPNPDPSPDPDPEGPGGGHEQNQ